MGKIPQKYVDVLQKAKKLGYKGSEGLMNTIPTKQLAKIFVATQTNETLNQLFMEYDRLDKTEKLKALAKECIKKKRPVPAYVLEQIKD